MWVMKNTEIKTPNYGRTRHACYITHFCQASVFALPPVLFTTFHEMYGISFTQLGTLVLFNFVTQMIIDLVFTFFSKYFNIKFTVRLMPILTSIGLAMFGLSPFVFKSNPFIGLAIGTVIFSLSAGLAEVLISPIVAAIPADDPEKNLSILHSLYGWGVVAVVAVSSLALFVVGRENWMYIVLFFACLPLITAYMYFTSELPPLIADNKSAKSFTKERIFPIFLCVAIIFFGSCAEQVMTNWISSFMELSIGVPKTVGDIAGMAVFAGLLAFARTLYSKFGRNIIKVMSISFIAAGVLYVIAGLSPNGIVAFAACIFIGFSTSMLWPGTLIIMEENLPNPGIAAYALMACAGDSGCSFSSQVTGALIDKIAESSFAAEMAQKHSITATQVGLKSILVLTIVFPVLGLIVLRYSKHYFKKHKF